MKGGPIIAIVDDDASVRRSLLRVVQSAGDIGETFASARDGHLRKPFDRATV